MDIVADMCLLLPPEHQDAYISSLRVTDQAILIGIASSLSGLFIGTFRRSDVSPYTSYPLTPMLSDITGWIAFGNHIPAGIEDYRFDGATQSGIETRAMRMVDALPVTKFIKFGGAPSNLADKVVTFRATGGLIFELDPDDPTGKTIRCRLDDAYKSVFLGPCNNWAETDICGVPPMRSFNGVCPDEDGRIILRFE